jgi:hypothetical protein
MRRYDDERHPPYSAKRKEKRKMSSLQEASNEEVSSALHI